MDNRIQTLLQKVKQERDKPADEPDSNAPDIGSDFSLFQVLGVENDEVKHSRWIGYLLNPAANHGHGSAFLDLFLQRLNLTCFDAAKVSVHLEKTVGESRRRMDIFITDGMHRIIIENKIWAFDQEKQLADYFTYGQADLQQGASLTLLYLTLEGSDPAWHSLGTAASATRLHSHLKTVSYRKFIYPWVCQCLTDLQKRNGFDPVLYSLFQYRITLENLLSMNTASPDNQLKQLLLTPEYTAAAFEIHRQFATIKKQYLSAFWESVAEKARPALKDAQWQVEFYKSESYTCLTLRRDSLPAIGLCFDDLCEQSQWGGYYGIICNKKLIAADYVDKIADLLKRSDEYFLEGGKDGPYLGWQSFPSGLRFTTPQSWQQLIEQYPARQTQGEEFILRLASRYQVFIERLALG
jgi:hypothetical protein